MAENQPLQSPTPVGGPKVLVFTETATLRVRKGVAKLFFQSGLFYVNKDEISSLTPIGVVPSEIIGALNTYDHYYTLTLDNGRTLVVGFNDFDILSLDGQDGQLGADPTYYPDLCDAYLLKVASSSTAGVTLAPAHGTSLEVSRIPNTAVRSFAIYNKNVLSSPSEPWPFTLSAPEAFAAPLADSPADYWTIELNSGDRFIISATSLLSLLDGGNYSPISTNDGYGG